MGSWPNASFPQQSPVRISGVGVKRAGLICLLLLPYIAMMWVPSYNRAAPEIASIPFFYWYQLAWIPLGSLLLWLAWRLGRRSDGDVPR